MYTISTIQSKLAQSGDLSKIEVGDHTHNHHLDMPTTLKPAAVLIACMERAHDIHIILTKRNAHLSTHPGQISFPGGRIDDYDTSAADAAVREAHEEIGLSPHNVTLLGQLPEYITRTGYCIFPFVAHIPQIDNWILQQNEVDEIFEIPLSFILSPDNPITKTRNLAGKDYQTFVFPYQGYYIWGATAGILHQFSQILSPKR